MNPIVHRVVVGSILMLGACTNLQTLQATPPGSGGTEFTRMLAQQYRSFAADEWNARGDFRVSEWFAAKGLRVNAGEEAPPEEMEAWGPWQGVANDLAEARARLMRGLAGGSRTRYPAESATAQRAFDCWLIRASTVAAGGAPWLPTAPTETFSRMTGQIDEPSPSHLSSCKAQFYEALSRFDGPVGDYFPDVVYFPAGRWTLDARALQTLRWTVQAIRHYTVTRVLVVGYDDTVGSPARSQSLSERRASEIRRALIAEGVEVPILTYGVGQTHLAVPTPRNTSEQRNRRAIIFVCPVHPCESVEANLSLGAPRASRRPATRAPRDQ